MAKSYPVARQNIDQAASLIQTGAMTVFANTWHVATVGSVLRGPPNSGDIIAASQVTVFAENKKIAIQGSMTAQGIAVGKSSPDVFAGKN
jgi:uncharacterized Zn-binding protein involved in type VI secretion